MKSALQLGCRSLYLHSSVFHGFPTCDISEVRVRYYKPLRFCSALKTVLQTFRSILQTSVPQPDADIARSNVVYFGDLDLHSGCPILLKVWLCFETVLDSTHWADPSGTGYMVVNKRLLEASGEYKFNYNVHISTLTPSGSAEPQRATSIQRCMLDERYNELHERMACDMIVGYYSMMESGI